MSWLSITSDALCLLEWGDGLCRKADFQPWLHGERTPFWSADLRGTSAGIDTRTRSVSLSTAILEGAACTLSRRIDAITLACSSTSGVLVADGGVRLSVIPRVVQDSVNVPTVVLRSQDYVASDGEALCG